MPLQATSGAASYDAFGGGVPSEPNYIEQIFQTYLYTGNGSTQTITNGIDLAGKGGLVWFKRRDSGFPYQHELVDTVRGINSWLISNTTDAAQTLSDMSSFNSDGFSIDDDRGLANTNGASMVSWTFRKQPKFFDVVTYTGNGTNGRTVAHSLGSTPGCIIVKRTDASNGWAVYHRSMNASPQDYMMRLNATDGAFTTTPSRWNNTLPTSTEFTLSGNDEVNGSGATYVAYLFAHNAGGFGLTGTDNVISCGSYTGSNSSDVTVNLGYEPQWVMIKRTDSSGSPAWWIGDTMRGLDIQGIKRLEANTSAAEYGYYNGINPTATGFVLPYGTVLNDAATSTYIYIAIRRGPMKVPMSGTSVFQPASFTSTASRQTMGSLPVVDMFMGRRTNSIKDWGNASRLTGEYMLKPNLTDAQDTNVTGYGDSVKFDIQNGSSMITAGSGDPFITYNFHRAPSFFDEVCYTGNGTYGAANHNLGVTPELVIYKSRSNAVNWGVIKPVSSIAYYDGLLNSNSAFTYYSNDPSVAGLYTSTQFAKYQDTSSYTYVAYLFATCAGVSKVGSYTGTGTTLQVNCGFTGGARFVLIKRTDSTGDWYVWDSARGIVSGNDPYLLLNSTAAEVTSTDYIDTYSAGFEISSTAPAAINASGGTFIFLAIA